MAETLGRLLQLEPLIVRSRDQVNAQSTWRGVRLAGPAFWVCRTRALRGAPCETAKRRRKAFIHTPYLGDVRTVQDPCVIYYEIDL